LRKRRSKDLHDAAFLTRPDCGGRRDQRNRIVHQYLATKLAFVDSPRRTRAQGAVLTEEGVHYRTRSAHADSEVVVLDSNGSILRSIVLQEEETGYVSGFDEAGAAGDLYKYRFDGKEETWPDPASCYQPDGVHGPAAVIDPDAFRWTDGNWSRPEFSDLVIYEMHVGTFTPEGLFRSAIRRLPHLAALGITAVEVMPIADFPGGRNWGYDGVMPYAPSRAYGTPDDLRAFVDAAHSHGVAVILDVVYNHLGPDGNYLGMFDPAYYAEPRRETPWGAAFDYAAPWVRDFFLDNALYWMRDFHVDGFRLDATHTIQDPSPRHLMAEIAEAVQAEGGFVIAEDERNAALIVSPRETVGWGFDAVWADDFHHVVRVLLTGENEGYYRNFEGSADELAETLLHGWYFRGQPEPLNGRARGTSSERLAPQQFVYCISNHDQVGNRAFGERLHHAISPAAYRAASTLLCLVPQTPMLFMGQEWGASTPFQFFTDHTGDLGRAITNGRRREFGNFSGFKDPALLETIPDPQAEQTFLNSKLNWDEIHTLPAAELLLLHSECLRLRRTSPAFRDLVRDSYVVAKVDQGIIAILFGRDCYFSLAVVANLTGTGDPPNMDSARFAAGGERGWRMVLSSNEARFGGDGSTDLSQIGTAVFAAV
jgi:maltooligosyltrehalose trehalohydrolase